MTWNYRIIHHDKASQPYFAIHEVFYDDAGGITNWTIDPINITGENKTELISTLKTILSDSSLETLIESRLKQAVHDIM